MRVSIIVPALNEQECITEAIGALQQLEGEKEIIVVDGGSSDETRSLAHAQGVRVLTSAAGRGIQMHAGALEATGDVLWFVHADTVPPAHALDEIRSPAGVVRRSRPAAPVAQGRPICTSAIQNPGVVTALRAAQLRACVAALDRFAGVVLVRGFAKPARPVVSACAVTPQANVSRS